MKIFIRTGLLTITIFLNICENVSGMKRTPERKPDRLIPYKDHRFIGVWKDRNGDIDYLHILPENNLRVPIDGLTSYIDEIDQIRFRVFHKDEIIFGARYEPLPPAHAFQQTGPPQYQAGPSQPQPSIPQRQPSPPQHQPGPPQHQPSPPQHQPGPSQHQTGPSQHQPGPRGPSAPYLSGGFITHDQTIFELLEDPVTGRAVDIRPHGLTNWVPTLDEINQYQIRVKHVNDYYPNSFVVYKLPDGRVIGSRLE